MLSKRISSIISLINLGRPFSCMAEDRSFTIVVDEFVPYICTAIHDGGNVSSALRSKMNLTKFERWQEEDPFTGEFISSLPIRVIVHDSRYECDLNRSIDDCIYDDAWGKKVWKKSLNLKEKKKILNKHTNFYKVMAALVSKIERQFGACLVFDIHSYNHKRIGSSAPLFNLGTKNIPSKYKEHTDMWLQYLSEVNIPTIDNITKENDVFMGNGYQLKFLMNSFSNTLVLATEIKKVFVDEESGDTFPEIILSLKEELKRIITLQAKFFANNLTNLTIKKSHGLLSSEISPMVKSADLKVFRLMKSFDVLSFVSPINIESQRKSFFNSRYKKTPSFEYLPLQIDASALKRELYSIPIHEIADVTLENLYSKVIEGYCDQIDFLSCRESDKFLYSSLKYFGAPTESDLTIARFLLMSPDIKKSESELNLVNHSYIQDVSLSLIDHLGFKGRVKATSNLVANATFIPRNNLLKIKSGISVSEQYANALAHHEIGVHMLTTENAKLQPLKILELGLPLDTKTQEGIAILNELLSGYISLSRLQELALRVIAVDHMIKNYNFIDTFSFLMDVYELSQDQSFNLCLRVYRGGGFTKDFLYLRGFKEIYNLFLSSPEKIIPLLIGKTSIEFLPVLSELIAREYLNKPRFVPDNFQSCLCVDDVNPILKYLLSIFVDKSSVK